MGSLVSAQRKSGERARRLRALIVDSAAGLVGLDLGERREARPRAMAPHPLSPPGRLRETTAPQTPVPRPPPPLPPRAGGGAW